MSFVFKVFEHCYNSVRDGKLIEKENSRDKEYHFQDWFKSRLEELESNFDEPSRNTYPDFRMVNEALGFELKGLQYPGRITNYDSNSQVPTGLHNGRTVYYVFGRYPKEPLNPKKYPVHDLIICHGDFINSDHEYIHKNKSVKGFGSYGDIMIRDRKMYVAPTPYALTEGTENQITLIVPSDLVAPEGFRSIGELVRVETEKLIVGYEFDLITNEIKAKKIDNPSSGLEHRFKAYRVSSDKGPLVSLKEEDDK